MISNTYHVGKVFKRGSDNIYIIDGRYLGDHGISNYWYWKKIKRDGSLSKKVYHGYGELNPEIVDCIITIKIYDTK